MVAMIAVWLVGGVLVVYLVLSEFLDVIGRLEVIKSHWPRLYRAMNDRPIRLVLVLFMLALIGKDLQERAKEKLGIQPLLDNYPWR